MRTLIASVVAEEQARPRDVARLHAIRPPNRGLHWVRSMVHTVLALAIASVGKLPMVAKSMVVPSAAVVFTVMPLLRTVGTLRGDRRVVA